MDEKKREVGGGGGGGGGGEDGGKTEKTKSVSEDIEEGLKKCLEENKGDNTKCKSMVEAFKSPSTSTSSSTTKPPITPLRLRSGSLTDV